MEETSKKFVSVKREKLKKVKYYAWTEGVLISVILMIFILMLIFRPSFEMPYWVAVIGGLLSGASLILFVYLMSVIFVRRQ